MTAENITTHRWLHFTWLKRAHDINTKLPDVLPIKQSKLLSLSPQTFAEFFDTLDRTKSCVFC